MVRCEVKVVVWGEVGQQGVLRAWGEMCLWSEVRMVWSKVLVCSGLKVGSCKKAQA